MIRMIKCRRILPNFFVVVLSCIWFLFFYVKNCIYFGHLLVIDVVCIRCTSQPPYNKISEQRADAIFYLYKKARAIRMCDETRLLYKRFFFFLFINLLYRPTHSVLKSFLRMCFVTHGLYYSVIWTEYRNCKYVYHSSINYYSIFFCHNITKISFCPRM